MASVRADNIEDATAKLARQREQNRLRQRRHQERKKALAGASLRPRPEDVDKAMLTALLDMLSIEADRRAVRHSVLKEVFKHALDSLLAAGHVQIGLALSERCRELQVVPAKPQASSEAISA